MKTADDAAEKFARGEITADEAAKRVNDALQAQERAAIADAAALEAAKRAADQHTDATRRLTKAADDSAKAGFGEATMFQKIWMIAGFATGSLEPLAAGLIAVTGGLLSGVTAAGLGVGVFGAVVKTAVTQVENANQAGTKLTGNMGKLQKQVAGVTSQWNRFVSKAEPGVALVLAKAFGLLPGIFKDMAKFLGPVETALDHIIGQLGKGLNSSGFQKFISTMAKNSGPSLEKLATAIGNIAKGIGSLMVAFAPFSQTVLGGLDKMTGGFAKWAAGLSKTKGFSEFMTMVKTQGPTIVKTLQNLGTVAVQLIKDMSGSASNMLWLKALPQLASLAATFSKANPGLIKFAMNALLISTTAKQAFGGIGKVKSAITDIASPLVGGTKGLLNLSRGFSSSEKAADEATGKWGTAGGKIKTAFTAIGNAGTGAFGVLKKVGGAMATGAGAAVKFAGGMVKAGAQAAIAGGKWLIAAGKAVTLKIAEVAVAAATKIWEGIQAGLNLIMDANPLVLLAIAIVAIIAVIVICYIKFKAFRDIVNDVGRAIKTGFLAAIHGIETAVKAVVSFISSHWKLLLGILLGPIALAVALIVTNWGHIKAAFSAAVKFCENVVRSGFDAIKSAVNTVMSWIHSFINTEVNGVKNILSWFGQLGSLFKGWFSKAVSAVHTQISNMLTFIKSIPGTIKNDLGNLGSLLFNAGKSVVQGLINGIKSMIGAAGNAISSVVSEVKNFLPFSPAKKGPLSGAGAPSNSGMSIARQFAQGLARGQGLVSAAAKQMVAGVGLTTASQSPAVLRTPAAVAAGQGGGAGGNGQITVNVDGQKLFTIMQSQTFKYNVRNSGQVTGVLKPT